MRLLVTRPEPDGEHTAAALRAMGHEVVLAPMLRIEPIPGVDLGAGPWAAVLLTSGNGARAVVGHARFGELRRLPVLTVGDATAQAAREAGFADVTSAGGDGADLARLAARRFAGERRPLLYLSGKDRARELAPAGLTMHVVPVYRAAMADRFAPAVRAALDAGDLDGVLHFSRRSAEAYLACDADGMEQSRGPIHYCLSERTAAPLAAAGAQVRVASQPDEAALLALVTPRP